MNGEIIDWNNCHTSDQLESISAHKNDLGVDCVSKQFMYELGATCIATRNANGKLIALGSIEELPSATPQEPKSEWEYDHVILKAYSDGANDVIDKIRAEIEREIIPRNSDQYDYEAKWQNSGLRMALKVIDKYKAESEPQESDIEKRKPCINYEDGCEEWAGCSCVHYKGRK